MNDYTAVEYRADDAVAWIRMNRPDALNAFNGVLRRDLLAALGRAAEDQDIKVVVLTANGRAFSAGADLTEQSVGGREDVVAHLMTDYHPIMDAIRAMPKPVIGVAPGVAAGVGVSLLMCCDQVVMAEDARLYLAFSHIGLIPDGGTSWLLAGALGYHRAFALITEGGSVSARECLNSGIARAVVPRQELEHTAGEIASRLSERSPLATAEAKRLLRMAATASFDAVFEAEAIAQKACLASDASRQAIARFHQRAR